MDIKQIPEGFTFPCGHQGRIERIIIPGYQHALVYLPCGYDQFDRNYNVFYLLHGGGGSPEAFFAEDRIFRNLLDNLIDSKILDPLIVVAPTYYRDGCNDTGIAASGEAVKEFSPLLRKTIIPLVDAGYRTVPDRKGRAIGGFSMGGVTTWYAFIDCLDLIQWYMPLSGDCWAFGELGGSKHAGETAALLAEKGRGKEFFIHAVTGTRDIAYPNLNSQIEAMKSYPDVFRFGGNIEYSLLEDGVHDYPDIRRYICNALPGIFD